MLSFMERDGALVRDENKRRRCLVLILCNNGGCTKLWLFAIANKVYVAVLLFCLQARGDRPYDVAFHNYRTGLHSTIRSKGKAEALPYVFFR